ncbi:MAG: ABC transporter ATP-binding protein [Flavobacteriales bacterium]|nr:ABC transporter ATP-binding protein [Flavobacteriales bacterium]
MGLRDNIYFKTIKGTNTILNKEFKEKAKRVFLLTVANGFVEVVGLALIFPLISMANDNSLIHTNKFLSYAYKSLHFKSEDNFLLSLIGFTMLVFTLKNLIGVFINYVQTNFSNTLSAALTKQQFEKYLDRSFHYFKNTNSNIITRDIANVPQAFSFDIMLPLISITSEFVIIFLIAVGIVSYDLTVFMIVLLVFIPILAWFYNIVKNRLASYGKERNEVSPVTYKSIFEAIHGYIDVKLTNREDYFVSRSKKSLKRYFDLLTKVYVVESFPIRIIEIASIGFISFLFAYFIMTNGDRKVLGEFLILFAVAAYRIMPSTNRIMAAILRLKNASYVLDILQEQDPFSTDESTHSENDNTNLIFEEEITLEGICFKYPEKEESVLNNFNLTIKKEQSIGLIGPSGSGKTTLVNIILRLIDNHKGVFKVDGKALNKRTLRSWRNMTGYVQQDSYLLDATLAENIAFGFSLEEINMNKLEKCIKQARLASLINELPNGINTNVGEFGGRISGGQKQRIAIARALYKEPQILILDEATSSLDSEVEAEILDTIQNLSDSGITIISIAHRISSLKFCDEIYELESGKIKKKYSYEELISHIEK